MILGPILPGLAAHRPGPRRGEASARSLRVAGDRGGLTPIIGIIGFPTVAPT